MTKKPPKDFEQPGLGLAVEERKVHRVVEVKLQPAELGALGVEAGQLSGELSAAEDEFDGVKKTHQAKIKGIQNKLDAALDKLRTKTDPREVECKMKLDFNSNSVQVWYQDELIEERAMTAEERQMEFGEVQHGVVMDAEEEADEVDPATDLQETMAEERSKTKPSLVDMRS